MFSPVVGYPGQVFATWSSFNGEFLDVRFQLYGCSDSDVCAARLGFDEMRIQLSALYGLPDHPARGVETPSCIWKIKERTITAHFFKRPQISVMLSVKDTEIVADAETEVNTG